MGEKGKPSGVRPLLRRATCGGPNRSTSAAACRTALGGLAAVGATAAIAGWLFVVKPMRGLSEGVSRVMNGDYEVKVDVPPIGPARKPLKEFNEMTNALAKAKREREELFSIVSHEFKTPLSVIQQYATSLQDDALPEKCREEYLSGIIAGTRKLSDMVGSMLEFVIANNPDNPLEKETYSLDEQLRQAVILFIPFMDQKGISYDADLDEVAISANKCLLDEVWANLISNAVKYTDSGSINVSLRAEGSHAKVVIADTGIGMSEEELSRAFHRFYRSRATGQEGVGLGLAIAQAIVNRHGGDIRLDSSPDAGTTCTVILPLR